MVSKQLLELLDDRLRQVDLAIVDAALQLVHEAQEADLQIMITFRHGHQSAFSTCLVKLKHKKSTVQASTKEIFWQRDTHRILRMAVQQVVVVLRQQFIPYAGVTQRMDRNFSCASHLPSCPDLPIHTSK